MESLKTNPFGLLLSVFAFVIGSIIFSSCQKSHEEIAPPQVFKSPKAANDAYAKLSNDNIGSLDCSTLNENALNNKYRAKTVAQYGAAGGTWYDNLVASYKSNPNAYAFNPAYSKIFNYKSQIIQAIQKGAKDLFNSYCIDNTPGCNAQIFWSSYLKDAIDVYLNPIKTNISNNGTLTAIEKGVLNAAIQAYYDNFDEATNYYATDGKSCFPDPIWSGGDSSYQADLFGGLGKVIRKIINIAATIVTEVVEKSVYGALTGLILGAPIAGIGTVPAAIFGAGFGGFLGLVAGVDRCVKGGYVCLVSCI